MDPHSFIARAEAQRWLGIAEKLLMGNDLVGSKKFAIRARESDPRLEAAEQVLAVVDTLLAAEKRVVGNNGAQQPDFYAILQLVRFIQDTEHIVAQYRRLALMLNPHQNRFPYSDQAFQLVNDAWAVLSNPMRKSMYDAELNFPPPQQQMNSIGFSLEQQQHHQQHYQQQQHQHNFFSIPNHIGSGHEQELPKPPQTFQTRAQQSHQQQHNFLSQQNPVRPVPVREQEQQFQPQVQPFLVNRQQQQHSRPPEVSQPQPPMPPPAAPPQPPVSWPQVASLSQPQQQQHMLLQQQQQARPQQKPQPLSQHRQQQPQMQQQPQSQPQPQDQQKQQQRQQEQHRQPQQPSQDAAPLQNPSQVSNDNGVTEAERESENRAANVNESSTIWTACPYCYYMYEYSRVYAECTLRCDNCKRAFQAVPIGSPPPIIEGKESYFCCWGFFPLGVSMSHLEKNKGTGTNSSWAPFSPLYDASNSLHDHLNGRAASKNKFYGMKNSGPRIYIDDVIDDVFMGISEPSDDSDVEWGSTKKKKKVKKNGLGYIKVREVLAVRTGESRGGKDNNHKDRIPEHEAVGAPTGAVAECNKKTMSTNPRRHFGRVAKELGKLDLNVEFNNNEGEESAPRTTAGSRGGNGHGEEDNIEGIGFFEGLDEFLSSLPILSVVNDEKVKSS